MKKRNIHDLKRYKEAKERLIEIEKFMRVLDNASKDLEKHLSMPGAIELFHKIEETKLNQMFTELRNKQIVETKGK